LTPTRSAVTAGDGQDAADRRQFPDRHRILPTHPGNIPFHDKRVFDSDTILDLHHMPETMLVIGGGVIGCEYACMFAALGIKVSLIDGRDRLLGFMDAEISAALKRAMEKLGIDLYLSDTVDTIEPARRFNITLKSGHASRSTSCWPPPAATARPRAWGWRRSASRPIAIAG
jgi:NADPH-dependent 2,4-dienoyl-CoA reductase/sulfur reductase-like enzyme